MSLREIMDDQPTVTAKRPLMTVLAEKVGERKDLRPILVVGGLVLYSVTLVVGATTVIMINFDANSVAVSCIESGANWVHSDGGWECVHPDDK